MRKFIGYSLIIGFFLAYLSWNSLITGIYNFVFASIFVFANFILLEKILNIVGEFLYGINVNLERFKIQKETKKFSHLKKEIVKKVRVVPLDYILTSLFGFLTAGFVFPILVGIKFSAIESKRYGKSEKLEIDYGEKIKTIALSLLLIWIILSTLKGIRYTNPIVEVYYAYSVRFFTLLTWSFITPFNLLLSYFITQKLGYDFLAVSPGDIFIFSKKSYYKAVALSLMLLPILGLLLDPITLVIVFGTVFSVVWMREKFREIVS